MRFALGCQMAPVIILCAFIFSSCAGGVNLSRIKTDDLLTTSSVKSHRPGGIDREEFSDQSTMRNAVSSASLEQLGGEPLYWENKDTGSRGTVFAIEEHKEGRTICRRFSATRESFDGVAIYHGDTCLDGHGDWWMREFGPA